MLIAACGPAPIAPKPATLVIPPLASEARVDAGALADDCPEAVTAFEVLSTDGELFTFLPREGTVSSLGKIECLAALGAPAFSMAIDRHGTRWVLFADRRLYRVPRGKLACEPTPLELRIQQPAGMGFSATPKCSGNTCGETLFMTLVERSGPASLATIDTTTFALTRIATFKDDVGVGELSGTRDGRLFMFDLRAVLPSRVVEIDRNSASVRASFPMNVAISGGSSALAAWRGDFFIFTAAEHQGSVVQRYHLVDQTLVEIMRLPFAVVGAGVSTCARE